MITRPSLLSLGEVEALSALEPYGADNPRPLFCIQGLTVDSLQNVGQNRHLKLRFSKGSVQLDGIFFSATAETCGAGQGDRVDAAFYLNVNEFRSRCSCSWQTCACPGNPACGNGKIWNGWAAFSAARD